MRVLLIKQLIIFTLISFLFSFAQEKIDYKTPLSFEENAGQKDNRVQFSAHGQGFALFLTKDSMVFDFVRKIEDEADIGQKKASPDHHDPHKREKPVKFQHEALYIEFLDINKNIEVVGEDMLSGKSNYFIGNNPDKWHTDINHFTKIRYKNIYPGIDLLYYSKDGQIEYDFILAPGADPEQIKLHYKGAKSLDTDEQGNLLIEMDFGIVSHKAPVIYQENVKKRQTITGSYEIFEENHISFNIENYDQSKALIIDPVLGYSTYLGGSGDDIGNAIALDSSGNVYVTGNTLSIDLPSINSFQTNYGGGLDVFVTKINSSGDALIYNTYIGGSNAENGRAIAVDNSGNAYITGETVSDNFPTAAAYNSSRSGDGDVFICKLNSAGNTLIYSTYFGGSGFDFGYGITVDSTGNAYITGQTGSNNFPTSLNAYQTVYNGGTYDCFVTRFTSSGNNLSYSTYLGGSSWDTGNGIAIDGNGNAHIIGTTASNDYPTFNPYQGDQGGWDVIVSILNSSGDALSYSTYLGGSGLDTGKALTLDSLGNVYITGYTSSSNFPTFNPYQANHGGGAYDAIVSKLNISGNSLIYSTYLGGSGDFDIGNAIAIDSSGNAYITGRTNSTNFPTLNPYQGSQGIDDVFVTKFNSIGNGLIYSTYLGGSGSDFGSGIAIDILGNAYITGETDSNNFPTALNAYQSNQGNTDVFISKLRVLNGISIEVSGVNDPIIAGNLSSITIRAQDSLGQTVLGYNRSINFSSSGNAILPAIYTFTLGDGGIRIFNNQVALLTIGDHSVTATDINYPSIIGNQSNITVLPNIGDALQSSATVPGGNVGENTQITLQINDQYNNPVTEIGGDGIYISITGSNAGLYTGIVNNGSGNYNATYTPVNFGTDYISITIGGIHIPGSPFTSIISSITPGINASIPNGKVDKTTSMELQINDSFGNPVANTSGDFAISISGANAGTFVGLTGYGNGRYVAQYNPLNFGTDLITISFAGTAIPGSPFTSLVSSANPELIITGSTSGSVGQTLHFTATGFDDSTSPDMQWDFGDGAGFQSKSYTSEHALSHVYTEAGNYTLTVEARDNEGQKTSASLGISISELNIDHGLGHFSAQRINPLDILLSWSGGNDDLAELIGYELYYSLLNSSKADNLTLISSTTNSSLIVNGFDANLGYRFSVIPVYSGNIKGDALTCDLAALLPTEPMPTYHLRFPHVAQNDQWWTGIVVVNPNANASSIQFNAIDQDGNNLPQSKAI